MDRRGSKPAFDFDIVETGKKYGEWRYTTIPLDNTRQATPLHHAIGHHDHTRYAAEVRGDLGMGIGKDTIKAAIAHHYTATAAPPGDAQAGSLVLTVPPGMAQTFTLRWCQVWHVGRISLPGKARRARYRYPGCLLFEVVACHAPGTTPTAPASPGELPDTAWEVERPPPLPAQVWQPWAPFSPEASSTTDLSSTPPPHPAPLLKYAPRPRPAASLRRKAGQAVHFTEMAYVTIMLLLILVAMAALQLSGG
jgi:hypothetical protein